MPFEENAAAARHHFVAISSERAQGAEADTDRLSFEGRSPFIPPY